ncbi:MAG: DMT family transporter [Gammaproteobacteria bacterium]|nr:DMT family transporter [Gammaproteobacteria bacterium]
MSSIAARRFYPALAMMTGASMWGVIWYPMRLLEAGGLVGIWLTLILYFSALVVSLPYTAKALPEFTRQPGWLALLMISAGWTNLAFVEAVLEGNILRVLLLFYLSPLWATLMGWLFLREHITRIAFASLVIAMAGALLMLWNPVLGAPWPQGKADWMALTSGFAFAVSIVVTRKLHDVSIEAKIFSVYAGVSILAVGMIAFFAIPVPQASLSIFSGAVALGVLGILVMTLFVQYGVTHMPVHRSAVLALIELVAGAVSQQLLTDEVVSVREWIGGGLIVLGAYLSARASSPRDY